MPYLRSRRQVPAVSCPCPVCGLHCQPISDELLEFLNSSALFIEAGCAPVGAFICEDCLRTKGSPIVFSESYWTWVRRQRAEDSGGSLPLLKEDLFVLQDPQVAYLCYWWRCARAGAIIGDDWHYIRSVNSRGVYAEQLHLAPVFFQHSPRSLELSYPNTDAWWVDPTGGLCPTGTFSGWARYTTHLEDGEIYESDDDQHADYQ